jgi:hypothetical protein
MKQKQSNFNFWPCLIQILHFEGTAAPVSTQLGFFRFLCWIWYKLWSGKWEVWCTFVYKYTCSFFDERKTSMAYPGFEPGSCRSETWHANHCVTGTPIEFHCNKHLKSKYGFKSQFWWDPMRKPEKLSIFNWLKSLHIFFISFRPDFNLKSWSQWVHNY